MATVGVRELKAHLSEHLKRVQAGERFTITDRGKAIATIAPVDTPKNVAWALKWVAEGKARWNGGKPRGLRTRIKSRGKLASEMVIEDRE